MVDLQGEGYYVYSDAEVNQRRTALQESMPPSIEEVMTPELITAMMAGTLDPEQHIQVPLDASDWNGVRPDERAERTRILENSLILGINLEEMSYEKDAEARELRAWLRTVREVEASPRERDTLLKPLGHSVLIFQLQHFKTFFPLCQCKSDNHCVSSYFRGQVAVAAGTFRLNAPLSGPLSRCRAMTAA